MTGLVEKSKIEAVPSSTWTILGTGIALGALFLVAWGQTVLLWSEVNDRMDRIDARIDRFEQKVDARFEKVDVRFEKVEAKLEKLDDKLDLILLTLAQSGIRPPVAADSSAR